MYYMSPDDYDAECARAEREEYHVECRWKEKTDAIAMYGPKQIPYTNATTGKDEVLILPNTPAHL